MNQQVASDNFSGTLAAWSNLSGANTFQISSGQLIVRAGSSGGPFDGILLRSESFNNDQYSKITAAFLPATSLGIGGIYARGSGTRTSFTCYAFLAGNNTVANGRIVKIVNGNLGTDGSGITNLVTGLAITTTDVMELRCVGTTISLLKNGAAFSSTTDAAIASGKPGIIAVNNTSNQTNQFYDDWSGGNILPDVVDVNVPVTGVAATSAAGSCTVTATAVATPTGLALTASQGSLAVGVPNVALSGQVATASPGAVTVTGTDVVELQGQEAVVSPGAVTITISIFVALEGQAVAAAAGDPLAGPKYTGPFRITGSRVIPDFRGTGSVK